MITKWKQTYLEYPKPFWALMLATFIDMIGSFMVFPFFALYITEHFNVGMAQVGIMFAITTVAGILGNVIGGAVTDKFGRKTAILYGLFISGMSSLLVIFIDDLNLFYVAGAIISFLGSLGGPARQAMVADILPPEQRTDGYGMNRVAFNLSATIGPLLGGVLAAGSYSYLFIGDAVTSAATALLVFRLLPETKPEKAEGEAEESLGQSIGGYGKVFRDTPFIMFIVVSMFLAFLYLQMHLSLPVYMRDAIGFEPRHYGYILSMNAFMVVVMQFWITRRIKKYPPMLMMALGTFLYMAGLFMFGFIKPFYLFAVAMAILTIGEMIVAPVNESVAAGFAPEDMRGRYMSIFGFSFAVPNLIAPYLVGLVMDNMDPVWVWYIVGIIGSMASIGFIWLYYLQGKKKSDSAPIPETDKELNPEPV